jgi:hypothetical protein
MDIVGVNIILACGFSPLVRIGMPNSDQLIEDRQ